MATQAPLLTSEFTGQAVIHDLASTATNNPVAQAEQVVVVAQVVQLVMVQLVTFCNCLLLPVVLEFEVLVLVAGGVVVVYYAEQANMVLGHTV